MARRTLPVSMTALQTEAGSNWVDAAVAVALGAATGGLTAAWVNVFGLARYDPKFADARIVPFFFDSLLLAVAGVIVGALGTLLFWRLGRPAAEKLKLWHYGAIGFVATMSGGLLLTTLLA